VNRESVPQSADHPAPDPLPPRLPAHWQWSVPVLLFGLALLLRGLTLGWGLPYVEHPDEPALFRIAVRMAQTGDLHPYNFFYPSLYYYMLASVTHLYSWWGSLTGQGLTLEQLPRDTFFFTTAPDLYIWQRALTALLGAATGPALYLLGTRMYGWQTGLLAGVLLAVSSYHIEHSQFITTDVPTGLWSVLVLLGAWEIATTGRWRGYLLAGLAVGLATGTKYNALMVAVSVPLAHLLYWQRQSLGRSLVPLLASGAVAGVVFLLTTPYIILDWPSFINSFTGKVVDYSPPTSGAFGGRFPVQQYGRFFWREGLMPAGVVLLLLGLPLLLWRAPRPTWLLLAAIVAEVGLLLSFTIHFSRNMLPIIPLVFLLAAAGTLALARLFPVRWLRLLAAGVLIALLLGPQISDTAWLLRYWSQPHTMRSAAEVLRDQPRGMLAAVDSNPVQWSGDPVVFPLPRVCEHPTEWYQQRGFRYLIINEDRRRPQCREQYFRLIEENRVLASFAPRAEGLRPGPGGAVLDLGQHPQLIPFTRRDVQFGEPLQLLGYEVQPGPLRSQISPLEGVAATRLAADTEQSLQINLYWQVDQPLPLDYWLFVHVYAADGTRVAQRDAPLRPDYPPTRWQAGELVLERADMMLPALPAGSYTLHLGVYDPVTFARLPVDDPQAVDQSMVLFTIAVE